MQKKIFVHALIFLLSSSAYAGCGGSGNDGCAKHHNDPYLNLASPGCDQLHLIIHNNTAYTFEPTITKTYGDFSQITTLDSSGVDVYVPGKKASKSSQDEVDGTIVYVARSKQGKLTGAQFTLHLVKSSCNAAAASCVKSDANCYCKDSHGNCVWNATCDVCTYGSFPNYKSYACKSDWKTGAQDCSTANNSNPTTSSTFSTPDHPPAIMTSSDVLENTDPTFNCGTATVCNASSGKGANSPGVTEVTINPARIEILTLTFPFDTQTPVAKILRDSVYNNLNSKYISQLGTYFSYSPVVVQDNTMTFSTLCNSANCP